MDHLLWSVPPAYRLCADRDRRFRTAGAGPAGLDTRRRTQGTCRRCPFSQGPAQAWCAGQKAVGERRSGKQGLQPCHRLGLRAALFHEIVIQPHHGRKIPRLRRQPDRTDADSGQFRNLAGDGAVRLSLLHI